MKHIRVWIPALLFALYFLIGIPDSLFSKHWIESREKDYFGKTIHFDTTAKTYDELVKKYMAYPNVQSIHPMGKSFDAKLHLDDHEHPLRINGVTPGHVWGRTFFTEDENLFDSDSDHWIAISPFYKKLGINTGDFVMVSVARPLFDKTSETHTLSLRVIGYVYPHRSDDMKKIAYIPRKLFEDIHSYRRKEQSPDQLRTVKGKLYQANPAENIRHLLMITLGHVDHTKIKRQLDDYQIEKLEKGSLEYQLLFDTFKLSQQFEIYTVSTLKWSFDTDTILELKEELDLKDAPNYLGPWQKPTTALLNGKVVTCISFDDSLIKWLRQYTDAAKTSIDFNRLRVTDNASAVMLQHDEYIGKQATITVFDGQPFKHNLSISTVRVGISFKLPVQIVSQELLYGIDQYKSNRAVFDIQNKVFYLTKQPYRYSNAMLAVKKHHQLTKTYDLLDKEIYHEPYLPIELNIELKNIISHIKIDMLMTILNGALVLFLMALLATTYITRSNGYRLWLFVITSILLMVTLTYTYLHRVAIVKEMMFSHEATEVVFIKSAFKDIDKLKQQLSEDAEVAFKEEGMFLFATAKDIFNSKKILGEYQGYYGANAIVVMDTYLSYISKSALTLLWTIVWIPFSIAALIISYIYVFRRRKHGDGRT